MNCGKQPNLLQSNCDMVYCDNILSRTEELQESGIYTRNALPVFISDAILGEVRLNKILINETKVPGGFSEIKNITKKLILNQCKISEHTLFIEGYIIKNISYVLPKSCEKNTDKCRAYFNLWRDIEVKVPFNTATDLGTDPNLLSQESISRKYNILCDTMKDKCCDCGFMGDSLCENLSYQQTILNEPAFAKIKSYVITDLDINKKYSCKHKKDGDECCENGEEFRKQPPFDIIVEKISLDLVINILKKLPVT